MIAKPSTLEPATVRSIVTVTVEPGHRSPDNDLVAVRSSAAAVGLIATMIDSIAKATVTVNIFLILQFLQ